MQYLPPEEEILPTDPVYTFKLADALDRLLAITGVPRAFEPCRLNDRPGPIRLWIAQAYAHGHVFMAPDKMWTLRDAGKPDRWYHSKIGDYEPLYHFIRDYPELFDGYESVATVALIFSNDAVRQYLGDRLSSGHLGGQNRSAPRTDLAEACFALSRANVPFHLIVAGDDWVEDRLMNADLALTALSCALNRLTCRRNRKASWHRRATGSLRGRARAICSIASGRAMSVSGADNISVQLRHLPNQPKAPVICHLLNSNYDLISDAFLSLRDVELTIAGDLLDREFTRATLYAPGESPREVNCSTAGSDTTVSLPTMDMWGDRQVAMTLRVACPISRLFSRPPIATNAARAQIHRRRSCNVRRSELTRPGAP